MTLAAHKKTRKKSASHRSSSGSKWVESTLREMTLEEKLGQLVVVNFWGRFTSSESAEYQELLRQVRGNRVGGLMLQAKRTPTGIERSQVYPSAALTNQMQRAAKIPLLVAADFETGTAMRLAEGTAFPSAMAVAATDDPRDAYAMGKVTAIEARAAGLNWVFAPVADVNDNADNPIINVRAFGENPQRVAELVVQYIRGVQENGALATAKHFPGHGDVNVDSHLTVPVVPGDLARLKRVELVPFSAAIRAGVASVMSGHLAVPAIEPDGNAPATLSHRILTDLLRKQLGFDGIIVTDALDMGGVTTMDTPGGVAVRAVAAGVDVLLISPEPDAAIAALREAVKSRRLPLACVNEAARRILRAKARVGLHKNRTVNLDRIDRVFGAPEFRAIAQDIAHRGITLLRDTQNILPLVATHLLRVLLLIVSGDPDPVPGAILEEELRWRVSELQIVRTDSRFNRASAVQLPPLESYDVAIAAVIVRVADRKGTVGLPEEQIALLNKLLDARKPAVVACLGSPYLASRFPNAKTWIAGFATQNVAQRAIIRAMFGQIPVCGKIPVTVPGVAKAGDGIEVAANPMTLTAAPGGFTARLKLAFDLLDDAVKDHAFPGGVLAVGLQNNLFVHPFGQLTYELKSPRVTRDTIYDVASLTKPIVTTTAIMILAAQERVDLHAPVSRYLREWLAGPKPEWRKKATVHDLLLHTSGLPAHRKFYESAKNRAEVFERLLAEPLVAEPGTRFDYSDLGFMLLGEIVERVTGQPLDEFARRQIFASLGMSQTCFNPPRSLRGQIPPTEHDATYRKRQVRAEVNDANAFAMGGVAGHAGLFSTALEIAAFARMMLNGGIYAHRRIFPRAIIEQFTLRRKAGDSWRALGWDVPTENSSSGRYFSSRAYGHSGFTGTSLWIDPEKDLLVVLLTNRTFPSAANEKIRQVRPAVHDAICEALGLATERPGH